VASGRVVAPMVSAEEEVMLNAKVAVCGGALESLAWIVAEKLPPAVGIPPMVPVEGLIVRPAGSDPATTDHA